MTATLQIKQSQYEARVPITVFALAGELDAGTRAQFEDEVLQAIDAGVRYIVLDLSQLSYISSAGLRVLYTLAKELSARGGMAGQESNPGTGSFKSPYLKLLNPTPNVRQALDVMGFTMSMDIYSDMQDAIKSF